jgi:hypothetical protein
MLMFNVYLHLRVIILFLIFAICHLFSYENWLLVASQYEFLEKVRTNNMKVTIVCLQVWMNDHINQTFSFLNVWCSTTSRALQAINTYCWHCELFKWQVYNHNCTISSWVQVTRSFSCFASTHIFLDFEGLQIYSMGFYKKMPTSLLFLKVKMSFLYHLQLLCCGK